MRRNAKGSRNLLVIASAALALSVPSMMVPSWAQELESDALLDSNETWIS